jgi:replicative DNA helicase
MAVRKQQDNKLEAFKVKAAGKVPPQNLDAEQSLLGSVLLNRSEFDGVKAKVSSRDFYEPRHRLIFSAMETLWEENRAIDSLTVIELLNTRAQLEESGGASYISSLPDAVPTSKHAGDYANIVRDKAMMRDMIDMSAAIVEAAYSESMSTNEILESADQMLFKVSERKQLNSFSEVSEEVGRVYEQIDERSKNPEAITGLATGFRKIDDCTAGFKKGELIIIAARPSLGKTSLAINIAYRLAVKQQKNILIFSFEMSANDLIRRMLAVGSKVPLQKIRMGRIDTQDKASLMHAAGELSETNIFIDTGDNNAFDMRAKTRTKIADLRKDGKKLDLVIIDYMQLVKPNENVPREQQISQISRGLKIMAMELDLPVVALSQLNRDVEKREKAADKMSPPRLSDLRESGAIEQDADLVMFIHREAREEATITETYESGARIDRKVIPCKLIIAKNRNGPVDSQKVAFIPELTLFEEVSGMDTDESSYGAAI